MCFFVNFMEDIVVVFKSCLPVNGISFSLTII